MDWHGTPPQQPTAPVVQWPGPHGTPLQQLGVPTVQCWPHGFPPQQPVVPAVHGGACVHPPVEHPPPQPDVHGAVVHGTPPQHPAVPVVHERPPPVPVRAAALTGSFVAAFLDTVVVVAVVELGCDDLEEVSTCVVGGGRTSG